MPLLPQVARPLLLVTQYTQPESIFNINLPFDDTTESTTYSLTMHDLGPFQDPHNATIQNFFHALKSMQLQFRLRNFIIGPIYRTCLEWLITVDFDFQDRGLISYVAITMQLRPAPHYSSLVLVSTGCH